MLKNTIIAVVVIVIIGAIAWYGWSNKSAGTDLAEGEPIKIGVISPMTGDGAVYGEPYVNILRLAADEINVAGGIDGHDVELIVEDGKCSGASAASAAQKLVNVDKVQIIIGGICSSESLAVIPVAEQSKVIVFSPGSSSPDLTDASKFFVRNYPSDNTQGIVLAKAALERDMKKVAFMQEQTDYAIGIFNSFSGEFENGGGAVVNETYVSETSDFRSQLNKLKAENPDALFLDVQTPAAAQRILKQLIELNWKPQIIFSDVASDPATVASAPTLTEGALSAQYGINPGNTKFESLKSNYTAKFGGELPFPSYAQTEYDALYLIRDAVEEVGYSGEKVAKWLRGVKNWEGASGLTTIKSNGDRDGGHVLNVVKNGVTVPVE